MTNYHNYSKEELLQELHKLNTENEYLKSVVEQDRAERLNAENMLNHRNQELKSAKDRAEISEQRLFAFINSIPDIICYKDGAGRWLLANNADLELFCLTGVDYFGRTDLELSQDTNPIYKEAFIACMETDEKAWERKEISKCIEIIPRLNGDVSVYEAYKIPVFDDNGDRKGLAVIGRDITALHQTQENLILAKEKAEESERVFDEMVKNIPGVVFQFNYRQDSTYGFSYMSSKAKDIFGLGEQMNSLEIALEEQIHPEDLKEFIENGRQAINELSEFQAEVRLITNKGVKWCQFLARPIMKGNEKVFNGIMTDITKRKEWEELLQDQNQQLEAQYEEYMQLNEVLRQTNYNLELAKSKAEENDKLKTAFLQNMSHEIRTPLNGILGFTNLLTEEEITKEEKEEYSKIIHQSGNRLLETINNVIDISKIETGQVNIESKSFSINSLLDDLKSFFSFSAAEKGLKLNYSAALDDDNCIINSDETKTNQILVNLINNAIKFTNSGGIDFGYSINENIITFYVKDTGVGVPTDKQEIIFERFAQVDPSISRGYEGSGLGLAICKGLVELLDGKIWIESEVNRGTTFYFTLPYQSSDKVKNNIQPTNMQYPTKITRILVAEDNWTNFLFVKNILKKMNCEILYAVNGEEAVEYIKNDSDIDFILMDIKMPVMDGIEATRQIKDIRPEIPIIAMTAYSFAEETNNFIRIGCSECITKPYNRKDLVSLVERYMY